MTESKRVVVVGVGNLLFKDEGIGAHTVHALQELDLPPNVELIDGGTVPDVLTCLGKVDKLIVIDAAEVGGEPGAIYRFRPEDLATGAGEAVSLHEVGVLQSLSMMRLLGDEPQEVVIIGVQPAEIDWGMELTARLQDKVPEIVRIVLAEIGVG